MFTTPTEPGNRVFAYVDGFNLYFGLKSANLRKYYWLNIQLLARNLLEANQQLICTKYFTARVADPPEKARRQNLFIEALETLSDIQIFYGKYQYDPRVCFYCKVQDKVPHEKMTDVNIAVELLSDAFQDKFDVAILITADSDLRPAVCAIKKLFPLKKIIAAFPPKRNSIELRNCVDVTMQIWPSKLKKSIFPDEIKKSDGFILKRPESWR